MNTQFIERNPLIIGGITAVLIVVALVVSLSLTREDISGGYELTAEFTDANGLRAGDVAIVAGIPAGKVLDIQVVEDHVEALIQMQGDVELPDTTRATITLRTLVGKRAIELDTGEVFEGAMLGDGDRIPLSRTTVATDVPELAESAEDLLGEIDSEALNLLLQSVADVTRDQREEVAELIDSGGDLTELVNEQEAQIRELLRNLAEVSRTLSSRDQQLVSIVDDLDVALGNLAARRADLQRLLAETQRAGAVTADLVRDIRADLDAVLDELHLDLEIVSRHQMDLAEALAYGGDALIGYGTIGFGSGMPVEWGHVLVTGLGPANVDLLVGCGGLIDQQIDQLIGPDPRPCSEQSGGQEPPDDVEPGQGPLGGPLIPPLPGSTTAAGGALAPQRLGIDVGPRSLLHAIEGDGR